MKGGHLLLFDQSNKFFRKRGGEYSYTYSHFTFSYTCHSYKHLDAWFPVGHPFWDIYNKALFGSKTSDDKIAEILEEFRVLCQPVIEELIRQFTHGLPATYFDPPETNGHTFKNFDHGEYIFRNNGVEMFIKFNDDGSMLLQHISPTNASGARAAYADNDPNVSAVRWSIASYSLETWPDIKPHSQLAKNAYDAEKLADPKAPVVGFDMCQKVYKRAKLLLTHRSKPAAEEATPEFTYKGSPQKFTRKKYAEIKALIKGKDPSKESRLRKLVGQAGQVMNEFKLHSAFLTQRSHSGKEQRQLRDLLVSLDHVVESLPPDSPTSPEEATATPAEVPAEAEAAEVPEAVAKIAHAKRKTKRRTKRQTFKPKKSTLRARRRTRVV